MENKKELAMALTRLIVLLLTILNFYLKAQGLPSLEIGEADIANLIDVILIIAAAAWAWWKNNNVTPAAVAGQEIVDELKNGTK